MLQLPDGSVTMTPTTPPPVQTPEDDISIRAMLQKMDSKLEIRFQELEDEFTGMFDTLKDYIKGLRDEVTEPRTQFTQLESKVTDIEYPIEFKSQTCKERVGEQTESVNKRKAELEGKVKALES